MSISLCLIVRNEAQTLPGCLASVGSLTDDIIVVDTGSTDGTMALARQFGAQVYSYPWHDDFAAARNHALHQASGDWILVLDADERLHPQGVAQLQALDQGRPLEHTPAAAVLLVNLIRQEVGALQSPYSLVPRLFRNHLGLHFTRPYHETVEDSVTQLQRQQPHWQVVTLPALALTHSGYTPAAIQQQQKLERARRILEPYLAAHPDDAYIGNKLGALYGQAGDWDQALALLQRARTTVAPEDSVTGYELQYHLGLAYRHRQDWEQAIAHYRQALAVPLLPALKLGAQINLGSALKAQGHLLDAIACFQQAIDVDPSCAVAYYNLGLTQRARGYLDEAIAAYRQAIRLQPTYAEAHRNLAVALFKLGQLPECRQSFRRAIKLYDSTQPAEAQRLRQQVQALGLALDRD
ncbi:putative TPR repeat domain protein [Halomicronema hongdechloris C2206]|uniref:TPR repeat domain protein n=1 Tax=Halomicronema hongdechloris C2206 TaxID=1641165 RepID=A0A1Z3HS52_9CYAN|nr:tetratricopeptide repeat protein [Halomicronema hongdechloris]ASC73129.1 putative TPR repeat domain protein [Halomicronema hongdechloris C2206]